MAAAPAERVLLTEVDNGAVRFQAEVPHLVSLGSGRLSTGVTLQPLRPGRVTLGSGSSADIGVEGTGVEEVHCYIDNNDGVVTLHPVAEMTSIDGVRVSAPTRLTQGSMLCIGRSNYLRFNHPAEARELRSAFPNKRISVAPLNFALPDEPRTSDYQWNGRTDKKPESPDLSRTNKHEDALSSSCVLSKVSKFETLFNSQRASPAVYSPKVFPVGSATVNIPASTVLSPEKLAKRTEAFKNRSQSDLNDTIATYNNAVRSVNQEVANSRGLKNGHIGYSSDMMTRSVVNHPSGSDDPIGEGYAKDRLRGQSYDGSSMNPIMSSSWTGGQRVQESQYFIFPEPGESFRPPRKTNLDQTSPVGGSGSSLYAEPNSSQNGAYSERRTNTPERGISPAASLRLNPVPAASHLHGSNTSLDEMSVRNSELELKRKQAVVERMREQECERLERARLDEILMICAEYERQAQSERATKPHHNRSPGNAYHAYENVPLGSPSRRSNTTDAPYGRSVHSRYENVSVTPPSLNVPYENVTIHPGSPRTRIRTVAITPREPAPLPETCDKELNPETSSYVRGGAGPCTSTPTDTAEPSSRTLIESPLIHSEPTKSNSADWGTPVKSLSSISNGTNLYQEKFILPLEENAAAPSSSAPLPNEAALSNSTEFSSAAAPSNSALLPNTAALSNSTEFSGAAALSNSALPNTAAPSNSTEFSGAAALSSPAALSITDSVFSSADQSNAAVSPDAAALSNGFDRDARRDSILSIKSLHDPSMETKPLNVQVEFVQKEIAKIVAAMSVLKGKVTDIEQQEEELKREVEMEKALVEGELSAQSTKLLSDEARASNLKKQIFELDLSMSEAQERDIRLVAETKTTLELAELEAERLRKQLAECDDVEKKAQLRDLLHRQNDVVDTERKQFEDIEFKQLEEEAGWLARKEELQRELSEATAKHTVRLERVEQLREQVNATGESAEGELQVLETQRLAYLRRIDQGCQRLTELETRLIELNQKGRLTPERKDISSNIEDGISNLLGSRQTSQDDLDRICRVTMGAPLDISDTGSLGRKTLESLKEIQRNRQIHLAQRGSQVIEQERRRVQLLKRKVAEEVRAQWEERRQREMNCSSLTSVTSEDGSIASGDLLLQSDEPMSGREDYTDLRNSGTSGGEKSRRSQSPNLTGYNSSRDLTASTELLRDQELDSERERDLDGSRPLSDVSSFDDQLSVRLRDRSTRLQQRPLTRYLPIRSGALDLRQHIESAGHQLDRCPHVTVDRTSCRGVLHKMASKFHAWQKRWFVFDRARRTLMYYSDRAERKARGGAYFQTIEEVYVDHLNSVKSPHPQLTFVVKTTDKTFHLMAPTAEAMRIWVDVIFTGAEGYQEFEHGS